MSEQRLTDARLSAALRAHLPAEAAAGLSDRIANGVATTQQDRSWRFAPRWVDPADPRDRSRLVWLAAALLLAAAAGVGLVAGAWQLLHPEPPLPAEVTTPLDVTTPQGIRALVHSTYDRMPDLPPMTITTLQDGTLQGLIRVGTLVGTSARIRVDAPVPAGSIEAEQYRIYSGRTLGEAAIVDGERVWVQQDDAISEDPRVFVLATLEGTAGRAKDGCSSMSPDETEVSVGPGASAEPGWVFVGMERRIGRDAYHLACGDGDLWIDAETRLILRSEGPAIGADFEPVPGSSSVIEVTSLDLGVPDGGFFFLAAPDGVRTMSPEAYQCQTFPEACATREPAPSAPSDAVEGPLPSTPSTGRANGWIAFATAGPIPGSTDTTTGSDIYLVRAGDDPRLIAQRDEGRTLNVCPAFSPDGTKLAYAVGRGGSRSVVIRTVDGLGVAGDPLEVRLPDAGPPLCPRWSADGTRIAAGDFVIGGVDGATPDVVDAPPADADFPVPKPGDGRLPSPTADWNATLIDCQLYVQRPDGTRSHRFPLSFCPYGIAGWSADGRQVLVMQDRGPFVIHAISMDDGSDVELASGAVNGQRSWPGVQEVSWQGIPVE